MSGCCCRRGASIPTRAAVRAAPTRFSVSCAPRARSSGRKSASARRTLSWTRRAIRCAAQARKAAARFRSAAAGGRPRRSSMGVYGNGERKGLRDLHHPWRGLWKLPWRVAISACAPPTSGARAPQTLAMDASMHWARARSWKAGSSARKCSLLLHRVCIRAG